MKEETIKSVLVVIALTALFGNIMFIVETFHPLGDWVYKMFGVFGELMGKFIALVTLFVDMIILGILCLPLWNKILK